MLAPDDRELLVAAIRPDPGYTLDHALITTYSLDLDALLAIPLALTFNSWSGERSKSGEEQAGGDRLDPVALLHSLREHADRLTVIGQAGAITVPRSSSFLSFLEPVVHGVSAPGGGVFHPKLWLLRYEPEDPADPVRYKLLCLTRNLTYDRSWDTMLQLDARLSPDATERSESEPLSAFVEGVSQLAADSPGGLSDDRQAHLATFAAEAAQLEFDLPYECEEVAFWPLGFGGASFEQVFGGRRDRTLVVSPFVTDGFIERIDLGPDDMLISRPEELALLKPETAARPGCIKILEDVVSADPDSEGADATDPTPGGEDFLSGLHAKLIVADAGWRTRLWTGSANATTAVFGSNVEFMVELKGLKSMIGIDEILAGPDDDGLEKLLVPYEHDPSLAEDAELRRLGERIDGLARAIGSAPLALTASQPEEHWEITLTATGESPEVPGDLEVHAWPATLNDHRAQPLSGPSGLSEGLAWGGLEIPQLTGFLCLAIRSPEHDLERRVAIALPLLGAPDRTGAVVRSILADERKVLRYLLFLLESDDSDAMEAITDLMGDAEGASEWLSLDSEGSIFESMVRALHNDPGRIDAVARLLGDLGEEQREALLPDGFYSVFDPVLEARRKVAR